MSSGPAVPVLPLYFAASFPLFAPDLIGERSTSHVLSLLVRNYVVCSRALGVLRSGIKGEDRRSRSGGQPRSRAPSVREPDEKRARNLTRPYP
jgi:hypothetical protein